MRKKYSKQFKIDAVKMVMEEGYKVSEVARILEIHPGVLQIIRCEVQLLSVLFVNLSRFGNYSGWSLLGFRNKKPGVLYLMSTSLIPGYLIVLTKGKKAVTSFQHIRK